MGEEGIGTTNLSMIVMSGATIVAAAPPETISDANRRPKFFVFHTLISFDCCWLVSWTSSFISALLFCDAGDPNSFILRYVVASLIVGRLCEWTLNLL